MSATAELDVPWRLLAAIATIVAILVAVAPWPAGRRCATRPCTVLGITD